MQPNTTVLKKRLFIYEQEWELEFTVRGYPNRAYSLHLTPVKYLGSAIPFVTFFRASSKSTSTFYIRDYTTSSHKKVKLGSHKREILKVVIKELLNENF